MVFKLILNFAIFCSLLKLLAVQDLRAELAVVKKENAEPKKTLKVLASVLTVEGTSGGCSSRISVSPHLACSKCEGFDSKECCALCALFVAAQVSGVK